MSALLQAFDAVMAKEEDFHASARDYLVDSQKFDLAAGVLLRNRAQQIRAAIIVLDYIDEQWVNMKTSRSEEVMRLFNLEGNLFTNTLSELILENKREIK